MALEEARWNILRILHAVIKPNIVHIDVSEGSDLLWNGPTGRHLLLQHLLMHSYLLVVAIINLAWLEHKLAALLLHRSRTRCRHIVSVLDLEDTVRHVPMRWHAAELLIFHKELLVHSDTLWNIRPIEHPISNIHLHLGCVCRRLLLLLLCLERSCLTILHLSVCELLLLLSISTYLMLLLLSLGYIRKLEVAICDCLWLQMRRWTLGSYVVLACCWLDLVMLGCMTRAGRRNAPSCTRLLLKHILAIL